MRSFNCTHFIVVFIVIVLFSVVTQSQQTMSKALPCLQFKNRSCVRCPDLTHLKDQQCYQTIESCAEYQYGSASAICRKYANQQNSTYSLTVKNSSFFFSQTSTTQYSSISTFASSSVLRQVSTIQALKDSMFVKCHDYMRRGEYGHFISRSDNPIKSVFQSFYQDIKDFKILYQGSGGNLLMCLISINCKSLTILLKSFVTIGRTQIIQNCVDYASSMQCNRCKSGYHLDSTVYGDEICVQDIPGCIQYFGQICTQCRGHYLLVENRCVANCEVLRDTRSLKYYFGNGDTGMTQNVVTDVSRCYF